MLVIDDVHELRSPDALRQLEAFLDRRPPLLRVVIASRRDPGLGLHRLRVAGELIEIRGADLRFTLEEMRASCLRPQGSSCPTRVSLSSTSGPRAGRRGCGSPRLRWPGIHTRSASSPSSRGVSEPSRTTCSRRCSSASPSRRDGCCSAPRFSAGQRTTRRSSHRHHRIAPGPAGLRSVRMRSSCRSMRAAREFRYHRLFADLLRLELERTEPDAPPDLHLAAAGWYEAHGDAVEAIRHAQAAEDWTFAARLVATTARASPSMVARRRSRRCSQASPRLGVGHPDSLWRSPAGRYSEARSAMQMST